MEGWIKVYRKILDWEWFNVDNTFKVFMYLLLAANHKDKKWRGITVKKGQLIASHSDISKKTGVSVRSVRTCINRLKSTGELTIKATNRYSVLTICNYVDYQSEEVDSDKQTDKQLDKQATSKRQASDKPSNKNVKNIRMKEEKKMDIHPLFISHWEKWLSYRSEIKKPYRSLQTSQQKYDHLVELSGGDPDLAGRIIDQSIREGWTGFFPLKAPVNGSKSSTLRPAHEIYAELYGDK